MDLVVLQGSAPLPASGYVLCFIPLATVIIGLISWFAITDRHASRPYLRYNPFVAAGATEQELEQRAPAAGETPAGTLGASPSGQTTVSLGRQGDLIHTDKENAPPAVEPDVPPDLAGEPRAATPKDLGKLSQADQDRLKTNEQKKPNRPPEN